MCHKNLLIFLGSVNNQEIFSIRSCGKLPFFKPDFLRKSDLCFFRVFFHFITYLPAAFEIINQLQLCLSEGKTSQILYVMFPQILGKNE